MVVIMIVLLVGVGRITRRIKYGDLMGIKVMPVLSLMLGKFRFVILRSFDIVC